jgi:hypothetical protein
LTPPSSLLSSLFRAQDFAEETQEFQTGIGGGHVRTVRMSLSQAPAEVQARERPPSRGAVHAYVAAVQALLQAQARALCAEFGVGAEVSDAVQTIWLAHLAATKILEPAFDA